MYGKAIMGKINAEKARKYGVFQQVLGIQKAVQSVSQGNKTPYFHMYTYPQNLSPCGKFRGSRNSTSPLCSVNRPWIFTSFAIKFLSPNSIAFRQKVHSFAKRFSFSMKRILHIVVHIHPTTHI